MIGTVQVAAFALGFLFLSLYHGVLENLESLLFGSFLGITRGQVATLLVRRGSARSPSSLLAGRPLLYASVDEAVARAHGRAGAAAPRLPSCSCSGSRSPRPRRSPASLLVFALLVAPAAAAQQLTARIALGLVLTAAIGLAVTWVGLALAYFTDYSSRLLRHHARVRGLPRGRGAPLAIASDSRRLRSSSATR